MGQLKLTHQEIQDIFTHHGLGQVDALEEIKSGSINPVFLVNNKYIFRVDLGNPEYKDKLKKEAIVFDLLPKFSVPTPRLIVIDESCKLINFPFFIINYIPGSNLKDCFSQVNPETKNQLTLEFGSLLKNLHSIKPADVLIFENFGNINDWVQKFISNFQVYLSLVKDSNHFSQETINQIEQIFNNYQQISDWDNIACLTHGDINPGNIRVNGGHIVGIFDFEYACIADPFIDFERFPISYQLGSQFDKNLFMAAYGKPVLSIQEVTRLKTYCLNQGLWEIWATETQQFPYGPEVTEEGIQLVTSTLEYSL